MLAVCFGAGVLAAAIIRKATAPEPAAAGDGVRVSDRDDAAAFSTLFQRGLDLFSKERYAEALEEFRRAAAADPTDPRPHHGTGMIYKKLVLEDRAEEAFRRAIEIDPAYLPSKKSLAQILHDLGRYRESLALFEELRRADPRDTDILGEIAINKRALGEYDEAISLLERYNAAAGPQAWGFTHLGRALALAGRTEEAERAYRRALQIDGGFSLAHYWLGQLLVETGRRAESEKVLATYRKLRALQNREHQLRMDLLRDPDALPVMVELARLRFMLGRAREALVLIERARKLAPGDRSLAEIHDKVLRAARAETAREQRRRRAAGRPSTPAARAGRSPPASPDPPFSR